MAAVGKGIIDVDLHGRNQYQARIALNSALRRAGRDVYRIRVIHGYTGGTVLKDMVREEYSRHPRVIRIAEGTNPGITELILREL